MKNVRVFLTSEPISEPITRRIYPFNMVSDVKIYIPKDANGKSTLKKRWYVYCYFYNPETKKKADKIDI